MNDLTNLGIDPNVAESTGGFTIVPAGKYNAVIVGDALVDNKAGTGKILKISVQITQGEHAGHEIVDNINLINREYPKAQAIGQGTLKRICNLLNVAFPPRNTTDLYGKPLSVTVAVEEFASNTDGKTLKSNKISRYDEATKSTAAPPVTQQPSSW